MAIDANGAAMQLEDHPVVAQLNSLKAAFDRVQDELHRNSVKLQSHYFKASNEHDRIHHLEQENKALKDELDILRLTPHPDTLPQSHPAVPQVQQLTLSLRKLSDQLSNTEDTLLQRTNELVNAKSDAVKAKLGEEKAYELAARIRGREEAARQRERELEWKLQSLEEQGKMSDVAMKEYASLVRSLEAKMGKGGGATGRLSTSSSGSRTSSSGGNAPTLEASFAEGKRNLKRVMDDMHGEIAVLHAKIEELQLEKEELTAKLEAESKSCDGDRQARNQAEFELDKLKVDDNTATKMVARYMKFSQLQTDTLQTTISTLKSRHAASIDSLSSQLYTLSSQLQASQASLERFQTALDELGGDIMRESFGRRNEVALRIKLVGREERVSEELGRWVRRAEERERGGEDGVLGGMIREARGILSALDAPPTLPPLILPDETAPPTKINGTLGRLVTAQYLVDQLKDELQYELSCKLRLRRLVAELGGDVSVDDEFLPEDVWVPPEGWMSEVPRPRAPSPTNGSTTTLTTSASTTTTATTKATAATPTTTTITAPSSVAAATPSSEATTTLSPKAQLAAKSLLLELEELEFEASHVDVGQRVQSSSPPTPAPPPAPLAAPAVAASPPTGEVDEDGDKTVSVDAEGDGKEDEDVGVSADVSTPRVGSSMALESTFEAEGVEDGEEGEDAEEVGSSGEEEQEVKEGRKEQMVEKEEEEGEDEKVEEMGDTVAPTLPFAPAASDNDTSIPVPHPVPVPAVVPIDVSVDSDGPREKEEVQDEEDGDYNNGEDKKATSQASAGVLTPLAKSIPLVSISQADSSDDRLEVPGAFLVPQSAPAVLDSSLKDPPPSQPTSQAPVVDSLPSSSTSTPVELPERGPPETKSTPFTHPLLPKLAQTAHRYDDLQRSFKECHLTLQSLKSSITSASQPSAIPREILEAILERLNDFVEDARVELEIRKSDEAVLCKGYETLLSVPGALEGYSSALPGSASGGGGFGLGLVSPSSSASLSASVSNFFSPLRSAPVGMFRSQTPTNSGYVNGNTAPVGLGQVEDQIQAFIDGTESSIVKAIEGFRRKLGDVEHDIQALKKAVDQDSGGSSPASTSSPLSEENSQPLPQESKSQTESGLLSPTPRYPGTTAPSSTATHTSNSSSSWSSWLRNPVANASSSSLVSSSQPPLQPPQPPASPNSTFGSVMTSPRLRHSPSLGSTLRKPHSQVDLRGQSRSFANGGQSGSGDDLLSNMNFRIPMPKFASPTTPSATGSSSSGPATLRQEFNGGIGAAPMGARTRTVSTTMYMLGLGASSSSSLGARPRFVSSSTGMPGRVGASPVGSSSPLGGSRLSRSGLSAGTSASGRTSSPFAGGSTENGGAAASTAARGSSVGDKTKKKPPVERDIDGDTDLESEFETDAESETEGGSDSDLE